MLFREQEELKIRSIISTSDRQQRQDSCTEKLRDYVLINENIRKAFSTKKKGLRRTTYFYSNRSSASNFINVDISIEVLLFDTTACESSNVHNSVRCMNNLSNWEEPINELKSLRSSTTTFIYLYVPVNAGRHLQNNLKYGLFTCSRYNVRRKKHCLRSFFLRNQSHLHLETSLAQKRTLCDRVLIDY